MALLALALAGCQTVGRHEHIHDCPPPEKSAEVARIEAYTFAGLMILGALFYLFSDSPAEEPDDKPAQTTPADAVVTSSRDGHELSGETRDRILNDHTTTTVR